MRFRIGTERILFPLWWTGDSSDETVSATIKLWKNVQPEDKRNYTVDYEISMDALKPYFWGIGGGNFPWWKDKIQAF